MIVFCRHCQAELPVDVVALARHASACTAAPTSRRLVWEGWLRRLGAASGKAEGKADALKSGGTQVSTNPCRLILSRPDAKFRGSR